MCGVARPVLAEKMAVKECPLISAHQDLNFVSKNTVHAGMS